MEPFSFDLELETKIDADQVCVGFVRPVEIVAADALGAALLEVQNHVADVDDERAGVVADAEAEADAVGIRKERTDADGRLRVLVVDGAEPDGPVRADVAVAAD